MLRGQPSHHYSEISSMINFCQECCYKETGQCVVKDFWRIIYEISEIPHFISEIVKALLAFSAIKLPPWDSFLSRLISWSLVTSFLLFQSMVSLDSFCFLLTSVISIHLDGCISFDQLGIRRFGLSLLHIIELHTTSIWVFFTGPWMKMTLES